MNVDEYPDIETHWIALHIQSNDVIYFHSIGVEHVLKDIKTFISNKNRKNKYF